MDTCRKPDAEAAPPASACRVVVAGPFTRADHLRAFITAVGRIEGVTGLVAEHFRLGELYLRLHYACSQPLAAALAALPEFSPHIETEDSGLIRLTIADAPGDG